MMCAPSSSTWAFALFTLSIILVAVSALPDVPRVSVTSHHAPRRWHNGTIGWDTTSDDTLSPPFVTIIASPSSTIRLMNSTVATSTIQLPSFTAQSSLPRLSLSRSLLSSTIIETIGGSKAASLAFSSHLATETSVTSSTPLSESSSVGYTSEETPGESQPASPSSSSRLATATSIVSSTPSYVDATTITPFVTGCEPQSSSPGSNLANMDNGTSFSALSLDSSTATVTVRGHTVLLLPGPTSGSLTTKQYASPTPRIGMQNTTLYPSHDKITKIAGISVGSSVAGGSLIFTIKKGIWMALEKAQQVHPEWTKMKVINYLVRGSHSTDTSWSSESTDSEDFSDSTDSSWDDFPPLTEGEGQTLAQVEGFLLTEESLDPGSVFEPAPADQVRSVVGEDAWGVPFAPLPPPLPIYQPLPPDPEPGKSMGSDRGEQAATVSDPESEYKTSSYPKTFGSETASAGPQDSNTATVTTFINGKTVLILPPGATRAPLSLPAVDQNTPWKVQRGLVSNATASNITGYVPPEDNSRAVAATIIAPLMGVPGTFVVSFGIYKAIREWVFHDGAIKKAEEAKNLADVMDRMIRVQERIPLTLEEGNEIAQIENFIMMRERYNPGGTYTTNEMMQIAKVLGKDSIGFWKEPTIKGLPEGATFLAQHGESNLFGKHGQGRPAPRPWPKNWGPAPPGLTSEEPDPLDPNSPATDPPEPPDEYTMSGGLGDPPPDEGVPPGNLPGGPSGGVHDGSYVGPPRVPWGWPVPGNIPLPGDDGRDADNGSNRGDDAEDRSNPPGGGDKNNDSSDDGSKDNTRTNEPKSLQSTTPTSKPRKSVYWQTPLTSNFPTTAVGSGPKAPGGGADDNGASDDGSNNDTRTNEPKSRQLTVPTPITSSPPPTSVVQTTEHETLTSDIRSVKTARQPTFTRLQSLTERNGTITGQPTSSQPPTPNEAEVSATGQSNSFSRLTWNEACAAKECRSSTRLTSTDHDHDSIWSHYISSVHLDCSSYNEYETCLFSRQPSPTSHRKIWSYHVELTNTWPTPTPTTTPLPPRSTVIVHTMVTISVTKGVVHNTVTIAPPTLPAPPPAPPAPSSSPSRPRKRFCGGNIWTGCCVYRYGHNEGLMDCFEGTIPHKHHMDPPCHDKKQTDCCIYRKGVAIRCLPTNIIG